MFVKICGITTSEDALLAAGLGADAVGMIFAASSRRVTASIAKDIVRRLPPEVLTVGVFRNDRKERVVETANTVGIRVVQLHGDETPEETRWIAERVPNVIRAFSAADLARRDLDSYGPVQLMIDSPEPGSGRAFDWNQLADSPPDRRYVLAGGLTPENLAEAIALLDPWGVDVATGVEAAPGRKDPVKLRRFIATARSMAPSDRTETQLGEAEAGSPFDWEDTTSWP